MKSLRLIIALLLIGIAISGYAQETRRRTTSPQNKENTTGDDKGDSKQSSGPFQNRVSQIEAPKGSTKDEGMKSMPAGSEDVKQSVGDRERESAKPASDPRGRDRESAKPSVESRDRDREGDKKTASSGSGNQQVSRSSGSNSSATGGVSRRGANAGRNGKKGDANAISDRQQSFYEVKEPSDADLQWVKVIWREVPFSKGKNAALFYPEMPNEDGESLYFIIMRLITKNQISAYEYEAGTFDDKHKIDVGAELDRFGIYYTEAKGSTEKNRIYEFEDADLYSNLVQSYYIIEKWEFDTRSNQMKARVEAICPVQYREDDWSGETKRYPMFWVKLNDIRPYMARQYVFTDDDNNLVRYSIDDFFKLNMYTGDIIKTKNLRGLSLNQMFPEEEAYKHAQDSIEQRLRSFNQDLWVPSLDVLQARAEAEEKARAEAEGEVTEGEEGAENVEADGDADTDEGKEKVTRSTKRGSKSKSSKTSSKSKDTKSKSKKTKVKERKPKNSTQAVNTGIRSVRSRKH